MAKERDSVEKFGSIVIAIVAAIIIWWLLAPVVDNYLDQIRCRQAGNTVIDAPGADRGWLCIDGNRKVVRTEGK